MMTPQVQKLRETPPHPVAVSVEPLPSAIRDRFFKKEL